VYVPRLIGDDALGFVNHVKIVMEKHTDLFAFTLGPIQGDSPVSLLSISSNLSQNR
jgi:hypothetical protein